MSFCLQVKGPTKRAQEKAAKKKKTFERKKRKLAAARSDAKLPMVVLNEKRDKKAAKCVVPPREVGSIA